MYSLNVKTCDKIFNFSTNNKHIYDSLKKEFYFLENDLGFDDSIQIIYQKKSQIFKKNFLKNNELIDNNLHTTVDGISKMITFSKNNYYGFRRFIIDKIAEKFKYNNDVFMLHATAVEKNGKAYLLVGKKNSGKSTISLGMLLRNNYRLISDDISIISYIHGGFFVEGIYRGINANEKTIKLLKGCNIDYCDNIDTLIKERFFINNNMNLKKCLISGLIFCEEDNFIDIVKIENAYDLIKDNLLYSYDYNKDNILKNICENKNILKLKFKRINDIEKNINYLENRIREYEE